jgi:hypothetical protein
VADRYLADGKMFTTIGAPHAYKVGDRVFFSSGNHTVAGNGIFIGRLKASPDVLVLIVGKHAVETLETECAPASGGLPAEAGSWRRAYLKERPGSLAA